MAAAVSAVLDLTLDTHAPVVAWETPTGATAGELLQLPYTTGEAIEDAWIILGDHRRLDFDVFADRLEVLLPPDTPNGPATVHYRDDVWNEGTHTIALVGVIVAPEPESPGVPRGPRPVKSRFPPTRVVVEAKLRLESEVSTRRARNLQLQATLVGSVIWTTRKRRVVFDEKRRVAATIRASSTSSSRSRAAAGPELPVSADSSVIRRDADEDLLLLL